MEPEIHSRIRHLETCMLHDDERIFKCSGTLKKGGNCANRALGSFMPGMMPTCNVHRLQLKSLGWCEVPLSCGVNCGRICEWKLHGFQLCPDHSEREMPCYLLELPMEMRLRICHYLLPDQPIPARYEKSSLVAHGGGVHTPILRVNRQIHEEAVGFLYKTRTFSIEILGDWLSMCNLSRSFTQNRSIIYKPHTLDEYPRQQTSGRAYSRTESPPTKHVLIGPIWDAPLSWSYFNMIQSFRIEIVLPSPSPWCSPDSADSRHQATISKLLDYCDKLHGLIGRLQIMQRPIARVEVLIKFGNTTLSRADAFPLAQFLLRPLRRLHSVARLVLTSITIQESQGEVELLTPEWRVSGAGEKLAAFLTYLVAHVTSSQPPPELPVFGAYWQLEHLLFQMQKYHHHSHPKIGMIAGLLYTARFARETEDLARFGAIWKRVIDTWFDCLHEHVEFQSNVTLSIDAIYDKIQNRSLRRYSRHDLGRQGEQREFARGAVGEQDGGYNFAKPPHSSSQGI